jgi:hypothetical protein
MFCYRGANTPGLNEDSEMSELPPLKLSVLREIGWKEWDPIGLKDLKIECPQDEYDRYMLHIASILRRGCHPEEAVNYLVTMAREYMGLSIVSIEDAKNTVKAVQAYLSALSSKAEGTQQGKT